MENPPPRDPPLAFDDLAPRAASWMPDNHAFVIDGVQTRVDNTTAPLEVSAGFQAFIEETRLVKHLRPGEHIAGRTNAQFDPILEL